MKAKTPRRRTELVYLEKELHRVPGGEKYSHRNCKLNVIQHVKQQVLLS